MKQFFYLLFLLCITFSSAQIHTSKPDYFVQYNGDQLSKKVNVAEILNHSLLKEYNKKNQEFSIQELDAVFKLNEKITVHGNYTDSISYYQITIPLKNNALLEKIILRKKQSIDSILAEKNKEIENFGSYWMLRSDTLSKKVTIAWNKEYLVIFELTNRFKYNDFTTAAVPEETQIVSVNDSIIKENEIENIAVATDSAVTVLDENPAEGMDYSNNYAIEKSLFELAQTQSQEEIVKAMFENGFVPPHSDKVESKADVSSWINCNSLFENVRKFYSTLSMIPGMTKYFPVQNGIKDFIKGINFNAYFEKDKAIIEETIEYNPEMTKIMGKIIARKINKRIYAYFPDQKPLGYLSYHINSEEMLKSFPSFTTQLLGGQSPLGEDMAIVTDLITTLVDEEATATLLDGDFSFFVNNIIQKEIKTKTQDYNENFEEIEVEKTTMKSIPEFTMIFTSTHPTFGDKLVKLGIRKGLLETKGNLHYLKKTSEYGNIFILKDKDVVVIGNVSDHFSGTSNTDFAKEVKNNLKKNALMAALNLEKLGALYQKQSKEKSVNDDKFLKLSHHFNSLEMQSPKKLKDNKFKFEMVLKSNKDNKNIILQFLDAVQEMK